MEVDMDKTPQQLLDEVWANNTGSSRLDESVRAVREMRAEDQRRDAASQECVSDDSRTPEQFAADLFRALGIA